MARYELAQVPKDGLSMEEEKQWLDKAYAPLISFLAKEMPTVKDEIISTVMYMGSCGPLGNDKFYYKNCLTRSYIILDQLGRVVEQAEDALYFI